MMCLASSSPADVPVRTQAQVEALIKQAGTTPPDWWNSVALNYPPTLDLTWAEAKGPWDPSKNLGQFIWSSVNENPGRWKEGAKLLHHVLTVNKDSPERLARTMNALGTVYHNLLGDYARAAFWWRKAVAADYELADEKAPDLAHCYWKLGSKEMAVAELAPYKEDDSRHGALIKLWGEMGELDKALALAEGMAKGGYPDVAYLAAGDACRMAGRNKQAMEFYQKVVDATKGWRDIEQNKKRARASLEGLRAAEGLDLAKVADGTYTAESMGYAGPIQVAVTVQGDRILAVKVTKYQEKQYYTALTDTPAQIVRKQGIKGVDAVTSATVTSEAIMNATVKALIQGMK
jgi:uncharacterized protein with FMN-binding domain